MDMVRLPCYTGALNSYCSLESSHVGITEFQAEYDTDTSPLWASNPQIISGPILSPISINFRHQLPSTISSDRFKVHLPAS